MSFILLVNNASSVGLIFVFWVLAHQNALSREPFGRLISAGYGLLALFVLSTAFFRNAPGLESIVPLSALAAKLTLLATLGLVSARLAILSAQRPH